MTFSSSNLLQEMIPGAVLTLRNVEGVAVGPITYAVAMHRARRGEIEGVGPRFGVIRFLREKPESAIEWDAEAHAKHEEPEERTKPHLMGAQTEIGAYRQQLAFGSVWALCLCRGAGV